MSIDQPEFDPFQWPPDLELAKLHYKCSIPGVDKEDGERCPCCNRVQKEFNRTVWCAGNVRQDFKNFGGGIPGYFYLHIYVLVIVLVMGAINVLYHIMLLNQVCPTLKGTANECAYVFNFLYICEHDALWAAMVNNGRQTDALVLMYLQMSTYILLVLATLGVKIVLFFLSKRSSLDEKLFSRFALLIKNVPLYYQLEDLEAELRLASPDAHIVEIFYLHKACQYQNTVRALVDLHFKMNWVEHYLKEQNPSAYQRDIKKMKEQYMRLFQTYEKEGLNLRTNSKKVMVVFNTIEEKQKVHASLKLNRFVKFGYYISKLLGCKRNSIGYFSERVAEPQEIYWKYIGESSTQKEKVRIETTIIGASFIAIAFAVLYFPMLEIDKIKIEHPYFGMGLGVLVSVVIASLFLIMRSIIGFIMPLRKPSNKLAEGYFVVMSVAVYFSCFYIVSPWVFYLFTTEFPENTKLGTFFMVILIFCISTTLVNIADVGYRVFNRKKNSLFTKQNQAKKFCQGRLHEELTPPSYPLAWKLVVVFNVWSFNSYYIFEMPYLLGLFFFLLVILYAVNKHHLYNHYRTQTYLSLELIFKTQRVVLVIFQICISLGYFSVTQYLWQKYMILGVFVLSLGCDLLLESLFKRYKRKEGLPYKTDIKTAMEMYKENPYTSRIFNLLESDMFASFVFTDPSEIGLSISQLSATTTTVGMCGYQETYNLYLNQFQKKEIHDMIETRYEEIKKTHFNLPQRRESELAKLFGKPLEEVLINAGVHIKRKKSSKHHPHFPTPPKLKNRITLYSDSDKHEEEVERQTKELRVKSSLNQSKDGLALEGEGQLDMVMEVKEGFETSQDRPGAKKEKSQDFK